MAMKYETVISTTGKDLCIAATLTTGQFEANIKHVLPAKEVENLPLLEIRASALKAAIHYAQAQLKAMGYE